MIMSIYKESNGKNQVKMGEEVADATAMLRTFMFDNVYNDITFKREEERADRMISAMYAYYKNNLGEMPEFYVGLLEKYDVDTVLCDFISGMSDVFAVKTFSDLFIPDKWTR